MAERAYSYRGSESAALKLAEYIQSETFTRLLCVALAVVSHGLANFAAGEGTPAGDATVVKRADAFRSFVFNGSNNSTDR